MSMTSTPVSASSQRPDFVIAAITGVLIAAGLYYLRDYFFGPLPIEDVLERVATIGGAFILTNVLVTRALRSISR